MELKARVVTSWPDKTDRIGGSEEMPLVEKKKYNPGDGCNIVCFTCKEYVSPKLFLEGFRKDI